MVGGSTEPRGSRAKLGALLVGVPGPGGRLRFAGHVGSGFSDEGAGPRSRATRAAARRRVPVHPRARANQRPHWTRPDLVAEVRFFGRHRRRDRCARHVLGLRDDVLQRRSRGGTRRTRRGAARADDDTSEPARDDPPRSSPSTAPRLARVLEELEASPTGRRRLELPDGGALRGQRISRSGSGPALGISKGELLRYYLEVAP